jgi:hypothetical protein
LQDGLNLAHRRSRFDRILLLDSTLDRRPLRGTRDGASAAVLLAAASALLSDSSHLLSGRGAGPGSLGDAIKRVRLADALIADASSRRPGPPTSSSSALAGGRG